MISFRFHLVSLVAVFLALGVGVIAGTTVLNRGIVAQLEGQTAALARERGDLERENARLRAELAQFEDLEEAIVPHVIDGRLAGETAIVVTQEGTEGIAIDGVVEGLETAGADVIALFSIGRRMALPTQEDQEVLAETIGVEPTDPAQLKLEAADVLASRLSLGPIPTDVLPELIREEFVINRGPGLGEQGLQQLSDADMIVAVGGGTEQPALLPERFLVPLVASLAENEDAQVVAGAESSDSAYEFVTLLRGEQEAAPVIATQDNVDQIAGEVGLVLALEDLLLFGEAGHYGTKDGATALIPPPDGS